MIFDLPFYKFHCCKIPLRELVSNLYMNSYHRVLPLRTCPFNINLINQFFLQDLQFHPKTHIKIFFSPRISPDFTVCLFLGGGYWETWISKTNPNLEYLSFRFTTNDKNKDAIRELILYRGNNDVRCIRVMKDPQWNLCLIGEQQLFEERKSYERVKRKLIREYFTFKDMICFATNWGCPIDREDFWVSDLSMYCLGELENDKDFADWRDCRHDEVGQRKCQDH